MWDVQDYVDQDFYERTSNQRRWVMCFSKSLVFARLLHGITIQ